MQVASRLFKKNVEAVELVLFPAQSYRKKIHRDHLVAANSLRSTSVERRGEETGCSKCVPINPVWDTRFFALCPLSL